MEIVDRILTDKPWEEPIVVRITLITFCQVTFILIVSSINKIKLNEIGSLFWLFLILFFLFMTLFIFIEWLFSIQGTAKSLFQYYIFVFGLVIFCFTIDISTIIENTSIIPAGVTLILVIITGSNAYLTQEITEKQYKSQIEPIVTLHVEENQQTPYGGYIDLIVENVGNGIAKDLKFDIHPYGFITLSGDPLEKLFIFQNGIQTLAPKQKYIIHITQLRNKIEELKNKYPKNIDSSELRNNLKKDLEMMISVMYQDKDGFFNKCEKYTINLCIFWGLRNPPK